MLKDYSNQKEYLHIKTRKKLGNKIEEDVMGRGKGYRLSALLMGLLLLINIILPIQGTASKANGDDTQIVAEESDETKEKTDDPGLKKTGGNTRQGGNTDEKICFVAKPFEGNNNDILTGGKLTLKTPKNEVIAELEVENNKFCISKNTVLEKIGDLKQVKVETTGFGGYFDSYHFIDKDNLSEETSIQLMKKENTETMTITLKKGNKEEAKELDDKDKKAIEGIPVVANIQYLSKGYCVQETTINDGKIIIKPIKGKKNGNGLYTVGLKTTGPNSNHEVYQLNKPNFQFGNSDDTWKVTEDVFINKVKYPENTIYMKSRVKYQTDEENKIGTMVQFVKGESDESFALNKVKNKIILSTNIKKKPSLPKLLITEITDKDGETVRKTTKGKVNGEWKWNEKEERYEFEDPRGEVYDRVRYVYKYWFDFSLDEVAEYEIAGEIKLVTEDGNTVLRSDKDSRTYVIAEPIISGDLTWENKEESTEKISGKVEIDVEEEIGGDLTRVNRIIIKGLPEGYGEKLGKIQGKKGAGNELVSQKLEWKWSEDGSYYYMDHLLQDKDVVKERTKFVYEFDPLLDVDALKSIDGEKIKLEAETFVQDENKVRVPQWEESQLPSKEVEIPNKNKIQEDLFWEDNKIQGSLSFEKNISENEIEAINIIRLEVPEGYKPKLPTLMIKTVDEDGKLVEEQGEWPEDAQWKWNGDAYILEDKRREKGHVIYEYLFDEDFEGNGEEIASGHNQIEIHGNMILKFTDEKMKDKTVSSRLVPEGVMKILVHQVHKLPLTGVSSIRYGFQWMISVIGVLMLYFAEKRRQVERGGK